MGIDPDPQFQSTPLHEGRQICKTGTGAPLLISIHAPARGATATPLAEDTPLAISIHAPARGATVVFRAFPRLSNISIHAPAPGATNAKTRPGLVDAFQSTPLHEGRQQKQINSSPYLRHSLFILTIFLLFSLLKHCFSQKISAFGYANPPGFL